MTNIKRIALLTLAAVVLSACGEKNKISGKAITDPDTLHTKFCEGDRVTWNEVTRACNDEIGKGGEGANCQLLREADKKIMATQRAFRPCQTPTVRF